MKLKKLNKKLKGATLLEAMLGMMIGLIVFASAGKIYEVTTTQVFTMKSNSNKMEQFLRLNMLMEHDLFKAEKILKEDELSLKFISEKDSLNYFFGEKFIIRQTNEVKDTFYLKSGDLKTLELPGMKKKLLTEFSFTVEIEKEKEIFVFKKKYPSEILINYLDNGNN
jgi:type II secretory pathway component PulJ